MIKRINILKLFVCIVSVFFVLGMVAPGQAAASAEEERALDELREAIEALPDRDNVTEADKPAIKEAIRMRDQAMADYGITEYDICALSAKLGGLEGKVDVDEVDALPPTGGVSTSVMIGLLSLFGGIGLLRPRRRQD